jgi:GNAT superfamily N-acetyltransferase
VDVTFVKKRKGVTAEEYMREQADVLIRVPRVGDGADLARVWLDTATYYARLDPELFQIPDTDELAQWCEDSALKGASENTHVLVAEHNGQVVGFISATVHPPLEDAAHQIVQDVGLTRLVIDALAVQQADWRRGIGGQLMDAIEDWGRSRGAVIALLDTYIASPVSVPFYEQRMGYRRRALYFRKTLA